MEFEEICRFCFQGKPLTAFFVTHPFDYRGLPANLVRSLITYVRDGFQMCADCAQLARTKDQLGLHARLDVFEPSDEDDKDREKVKLTLRMTALMMQQIFVLGLATELGKTIRIYDHIDPPFRVFFDLCDVAGTDDSYPRFKNGVELWCSPLDTSNLWLEEIRSRHQGNHHASNVMRLVVASADVHEVTLRGVVESHPVNGEVGLSDADLFSWYETVGFRKSGITPNAIVREPVVDVDLRQRKAAYEDAARAIRNFPANS